MGFLVSTRGLRQHYIVPVVSPVPSDTEGWVAARRAAHLPAKDYLWQQDAPLPDMSGLTYGMPRDMPRRISSVASRKTQTGMVFTSLRRSEAGTSFPERLIASIIGTVPTPNAVI